MISNLPQTVDLEFTPTPVFKPFDPQKDQVARTYHEGMYFLASEETYNQLVSLVKEAGGDEITALKILTAGSIIDQSYVGKRAKVHLCTKTQSGAKILAAEYFCCKVPNIRLQNLKTIYHLHQDGYYRAYKAVRISDSLLNKLADAVCQEETYLYTDQFSITWHQNIVRFFRENVLKRPSGELGMMWAWTHFPNIEEDEVGFDVTVAKEWISKSLYMGYQRELISREECILATGIGNQFPGILNGVQILGLRHPVSSANGTDPLSIRVVNAHSRMVGVTAETAKKRLGDFDHDLFFGGYGKLYFTLEEAVKLIMDRVSMFEEVK
jgi:hypothetical protein